MILFFLDSRESMRVRCSRESLCCAQNRFSHKKDRSRIWMFIKPNWCGGPSFLTKPASARGRRSSSYDYWDVAQTNGQHHSSENNSSVQENANLFQKGMYHWMADILFYLIGWLHWINNRFTCLVKSKPVKHMVLINVENY